MSICLIARNSRRGPCGPKSRGTPAPRLPRPCVYIPQAVRVLQWRSRSLAVGLRSHPPARSSSASSPAPSSTRRCGVLAVASVFEWLLLDAHLLLGGGLLDAEPLAADHGAVHRLQCTHSARAITAPPPQYLLLPTFHYSRLNYSLTHSLTNLHRRVGLLGRREGDEPEALAHLVKG